MTSIVVTCAGSPIGQHLIRELLSDPSVRHVVAVGPGSSGGNGPVASDRLIRHQVDLTRGRDVREVLYALTRDLGVEVIVHLGEPDGVGSSMRGGVLHGAETEAVCSLLDLAEGHPTVSRVVVRSYAEVYRVANDLPVLVAEDQPLELSPRAPATVRHHVEADLTACSRMGASTSDIVVLRCAEALAPGTGSQLHAYLSGPIALRPAGFDPMVNVASIADIALALGAAARGTGSGVYNIPGFDTLPLSEACRRWGVRVWPLPGPIVAQLYGLRHQLTGALFSYGLNRRRMHVGLVLDGRRARTAFGYAPRHPVDWPVPG